MLHVLGYQLDGFDIVRARSDRIEHCAELLYVVIQQLETVIRFVHIDYDLVAYLLHTRRRFLAHSLYLHLHPRSSNFRIGITRSIPLIMQEASAANSNPAGLKASSLPARSVSKGTDADLQMATLP
jgi:hypothetical protein